MGTFVGSPEEYSKRSHGTKCIVCRSIMQPDGLGVSCENGHDRVVFTTMGGPSYSTLSDSVAEVCKSRALLVQREGRMWSIKPKKKWWKIW